jgi:L-alanine-DL-glutamate epimerase-like enolase superfamily enzyme
MKITALETLRAAEHPNLLWVRVHTDAGLIGLGETFYGAAAVEAHLHEIVAPRLIGIHPLAIDAISKSLGGFLGYRSTGAEVRAASAIDIALWDIFGKATGQPIWQLLGGRSRNAIRTYNTCAGTHYIRTTRQQSSANWGRGVTPKSGYDDLDAFLTRPGELALELLESGITAMKIWPFDAYAEKSDGLYISAEDLRSALQTFERIRKAVGDKMDVMVEFHGLWQLPPAIRIAEALVPYDTFWHEDPIRMDSLGSLRRYAERSRAPVCASETLSSRWGFRDLLETEAAGIIMLDLSWCGGLSEGRKIAAMAEAWHLPVAPHDCTGPVVLAASTHLALSAPNALIQESVRAFYLGWYNEMVTAVPPVKDGFITVPPGPGLGLELRDDLDRRFTLTSRRSPS